MGNEQLVDSEKQKKTLFFFPFHFKLTGYIVALTILLLIGFSLVVNTLLTKDFTRRIEERLSDTNQIVSRLMKVRRQQLRDYGLALSEYQLVLRAVRSPELDIETRNDILKEEVLPYYSEVESIFVASPDGSLIANSDSSNLLAMTAINLPVFKSILSGESFGIEHIFVGELCYQVLGIPVYVNDIMTHILFVAMLVGDEFVSEIYELSGVDITLFHGDKVFLRGKKRESKREKAIVDGLERLIAQRSFSIGKIHHTVFNDERFLYTFSSSKDSFVPTYVLFRSLDQELILGAEMQSKLFIIGFAAMGIALVGSYFLSRGVARPIGELSLATEAVRESKYDYRVHINTHDEFRDLGTAFNRMIQGLEEKDRIRSLIDKVVSKEIAHELIYNDQNLGGSESKISVLFSDIRGFTALSEKLSPSELLNLLNRYFSFMTACIDKNKGVIDKYIGDALMALFGAPEKFPFHAKGAVLSALEMLKALSLFNKENRFHLNKSLEIGIGINTGHAIVGAVGTEKRMNYTAIGDEVNIAARLEGMCKTYGASIIISEATYIDLQRDFTSDDSLISCRHLEDIRVRGKINSTRIYEVLPPEEERPYKEEMLKQFNDGRSLMHSRDFKSSAELFRDIAMKFPKDVPSQIFLERSQRYCADPELFEKEYPDGVYTALRGGGNRRRKTDRRSVR